MNSQRVSPQSLAVYPASSSGPQASEVVDEPVGNDGLYHCHRALYHSFADAGPNTDMHTELRKGYINLLGYF